MLMSRVDLCISLAYHSYAILCLSLPYCQKEKRPLGKGGKMMKKAVWGEWERA